MINEISINNCFAFNKHVVFDLSADMRQKRLSLNVIKSEACNVLKSAILFGTNNTGKTCFVKAIETIKNIMLNRPVQFSPNLFTGNPVSELGIKFIFEEREYSFLVKYDFSIEGFCYEKFSCFDSPAKPKKENVLLIKDIESSNNNVCENTDLLDTLKLLGNKNLVIYQLDTEKFPELDRIKNILQSAANGIQVVHLNDIPIKKTISILKNEGSEKQKIVDFVTKADLYLNNMYYQEIEKLNINEQDGSKMPNEKVLSLPEYVQDSLRLMSVYKDLSLPSFIFDSAGTKKMTALASYIIEALEKGQTLFVDEIDSGLHFKLTRAIVAMFNNDANTNAQLIATAHDVNLLDCKRLLRKEQIWFVDKDEEGVSLYSLNEFKAKEGTRSCSNIIDKYKKGLFGAIPNPDFIELLLEVTQGDHYGPE